MLKSIPKASVSIACLVWSGIACAAGLGGINVTSSLGQPLKAEIEVVAVDKADKSSLKARLASVDAYKNAGVDYPYSIPKLTFQIEERADGEPYVKVTTAQPVNDPFVTLMVELSWASGKLMREYTFLLDPVGYKPEQPQPEAVEPVLAAPVVEPAPIPLATASEAAPAEPQMEAPAVEAASAVAPAPEGVVAAAPAEIAPASAPAGEVAPAEVPALETAPGAETVPAENPPVEKALTQEQPSPAPAAEYGLSREEAIPEPTPPEHIVVMRGDTLTKIAAQIKPADVSLERMLVSLYRENAGIFDGHNMNRIRAGKILTIPSAEATRMLPQADAEEEIRAQAADWNAYRQKLAAVRMPAPEHAEKQEASGKISAAVTDKALPAKTPAKEVLRLSKGEAPTEKAAGGGKALAEEKAAAKEEEAIATSKALKEAEERTAILEKNVQEMQRLEELKTASAPASTPAVAVPVAAASAPQPASAVAPAKPRKPVAAPPKVVEQPSMIDQLLGEPLYLGGAAVLVLALGGLGFMVARRRKQGGGQKKVEEVGGSTTGRIAAPVVPSPETGDFTHAPALAGAVAAAAPETEEVDPIGEADLFLTFGRDVQAEEVLKEALKKNPNNVPVKLKLLSIYSNRKDTNSFYSYAREIKDSGDASAWEQTAAMGRELEPSNPFYGGSGGGAAAPAPEVKAAAAAPVVDFDLGFGTPAPATSAAPEFGSQSTIVMETPTPEKTTVMTTEELRTAQAAPMDFDITGTNPGVVPTASGQPKQPEAALDMGDLVFDVTATHPQVPLTEAAAPAATAEDTGLTFTLDFPLETKAKPAAPAPDLGLGEISLDLDKLGTPATAGAAGVKDEHWQEVATKLDLAKAYQEMGDTAGAREILEEVLRDGDEQQRESAQALMQQL